MRFVIFGAACLLLGACDRLPAQANAAPTRTSEFAVSALGRIDVAGHTRRLAPRRRGVIETLTVDVGSRVKAGALLASLHCEAESASMTAATAALQLTQAQRDQLRSGARREAVSAAQADASASSQRMLDTRDQLERLAALQRSGLQDERAVRGLAHELRARASEHEAARARVRDLQAGPRDVDLALADARVAAAAADIETARAAADACTLRAPSDGRVVQIFKRPGEFVAADVGEAVLAFAGSDELIIKAELDERDIGRVAVGAAAAIRLRGSTVDYPGTVYQIAGQVGRTNTRSDDPADRFDRDTLEALVRIEAQAPELVIGRQAVVEFLVQ